MKLTVITINYNNRQGLTNTIQSVEAQSVKNFEWIVVDGASTDGSRELITEHTDIITTWVSEPDLGIYNAMNKGIRMAHGEYLLFLNSGDYLATADVIKKVLPYLKDSDYFIGCTYHSNNMGVENVHEEDLRTDKMLFRLITHSLPHQASFMRRSLFDEYGFYREDLRIVSDWVFMLDSIILGKTTVKYLPFVVAIYDDNGISSTDKQLNRNERMKVMNERPRLKQALDFYSDNYELVNAIKNNKAAWFINRIIFFFHRLFNDKKEKR